ncbi:fibronectin type III domain-containing protein [Pseudarthrobacter sp. R1]|uniref:fibronectin type III domain-containing protein n=1 Tax=Pseudarthrobacter sp. R1 TaxID=2944934 RepID=UPI00210A526D|nr:fibronectin type III domain-containing protein [Pseudarthrobacter sp. R1]MCQ6271212.1 fibronectin type III domain-containing protein [Pseudarthrobacter sp. R1]
MTASIAWTPPATTGGSPTTGYKVTALRMSSGANNATVVSRTDSAVLPATARTLEMTLTGSNYRFVVVAINGVGTSPESARSNSVVAR